VMLDSFFILGPPFVDIFIFHFLPFIFVLLLVILRPLNLLFLT
jgi:hypothetical protein